jgi:hypothetical protein
MIPEEKHTDDELLNLIQKYLKDHKNNGHDIEIYRKEFIEITEMRFQYRLDALKFLNKISIEFK